MRGKGEEKMEAENCKGSSYVDEAMLPGFRFYPTDEELVGFYLRRKVEKKPLKIELIKQIDIYKYDPWDLPKASNAGDDEGYFFCMRGRKYRNSIRPNRVTGSGFWKATGIDKPIYTSQEPPECIGLKKSLVYYLGSAGKGNKTDWMMHEFRLPPPTMKNTNNNKGNLFGAKIRNAAEEAEVWTLCRIFKRTPSYRRYVPETKNNITSPKKSPVDSSSKACSWESEHGERCLSFGDSFKKNNDRKPSLIGINHSQYHNVDNVHHQAAAATTTYPAFWNFNNGEDVLSNGNWDELTSFFHGASGS